MPDLAAPSDPLAAAEANAKRLAWLVMHEAIATRRDDLLTINLQRWRSVLAGGICPAFTAAEFDLTWSLARPIVCSLLRDARRRSGAPLKLQLPASPRAVTHLLQEKGAFEWF